MIPATVTAPHFVNKNCMKSLRHCSTPLQCTWKFTRKSSSSVSIYPSVTRRGQIWRKVR